MSEPQPTQVPVVRSLRDLRLSDLMLIVIAGLLVTRLGGLLAQWLLADADGASAAERTNLLGVVVLALGVQAVGLVGAVYGVAVRLRGLAWAEIGLRPVSRTWLVRAAIVALLAYLLVAVINLGIQSNMSEAQRNPQLDVLAPVGFDWTALLAMLILAGAIVPFAEELFFRGLLYGWLRARMGVPIAAALSALCFSMLHGIAWLMPALVLLGVILAVVYERSGSIWAATVTHGLFNTITTILFYIVLAAGLEM